MLITQTYTQFIFFQRSGWTLEKLCYKTTASYAPIKLTDSWDRGYSALQITDS